MASEELDPVEGHDAQPVDESSAERGEGRPEFDEREDLFDFEEFVLEHAGSGVDDDFNLDELLDAISSISDAEETGDSADRSAEGGPGTAVKMGEELLHQILAAQQQIRDADRVDGAAPPRAPRTRPTLSLVAIAAVITMTLLNAGVVGYSWLANRDIKDEMLRFADDVIAVTEQVREDTSRQVRELEALQGPLTSRDPEYSRAFDKVRELIDAGEHLEARRQLYSLLAVLDRLEESVRADAEARASFLLGDTLRLEAMAREAAEGPQ